MTQLKPYQLLTKRAVILQGRATTDSVYGDKSQLVFDITNLELLSPRSQPLTGTIGMKGFGPAMIYRGDSVQVSGKLYPTRGGRQAAISFAKITMVRRGQSQIDVFRRRFAAGINSVLPEPLGSLGLGVLIGQRTTLPDSLNQQLSVVGLTHIVAVSGYNLMIIVAAARRLLHKRSKYQATAATVLLMILFVVLTGTSASIVRAALVCSLSLATWYYGRRFRPHVLILLAAALTAGWYPIYLWSDLGWHLSFLAFTGILLLAPLVQQRLGQPRRLKLLLATLLETASAQLLTLPLIMFIFGNLSVIGLLANVVVVPLVPMAMLASVIAGAAGALVPQVAGWLAWPARLILEYIISAVQSLASMPYAAVQQSLGVRQMLFLYWVITSLMFILWRKNGKITDTKQRISVGAV